MNTFGLDSVTHELRGPAGRMRVRRQVILLAAALLRTPGEVVPYAAITAAMWPPPAVPPAQLEHCIRRATSTLRIAMGTVGAKEVVQTHRAAGLSIMLEAPTPTVEDHEPAPAPRCPSLIFDQAARTLRHGRQEIALGKQDALILWALLSADGFATTAELLAVMYPDGKKPAGAGRVLRVRVSALRSKLRTIRVPVEIAATYGVGYQLRAEERRAEAS